MLVASSTKRGEAMKRVLLLCTAVAAAAAVAAFIGTTSASAFVGPDTGYWVGPNPDCGNRSTDDHYDADHGDTLPDCGQEGFNSDTSSAVICVGQTNITFWYDESDEVDAMLA